MKYDCIKCNYATNDKSNYKRHLNSDADIQKYKLNTDLTSEVKSLCTSKNL